MEAKKTTAKKAATRKSLTDGTPFPNQHTKHLARVLVLYMMKVGLILYAHSWDCVVLT